MGRTERWLAISEGITPGPHTREALFRIRVQQILKGLAGQYPSVYVTADFWRYTVVSADPNTYLDKQPQTWVRLSESIPVFFFEKHERFYQAGTGIINQRKRYVICPDNLGLVSGDTVIVNGNSLMISEHEEMVGVCRLTVEQEKSNFVQPARNAPTYRQLGMKARIA